MTKWAIEYEVPAAEAFRLNHPGAATFTDNCNVILARAMANAGLQGDCRASPEVLRASGAVEHLLDLNPPIALLNGSQSLSLSMASTTAASRHAMPVWCGLCVPEARSSLL